ncbi:MAG: histidine kinase [Clostridiales bacterium]|nr:histidine kinase [Clostridiales bacterium]
MKRKKSLQQKLWFLIGVLVLPLNIISLIISNIMINDARVTIQNSINATVNTYAESIEQTAYNTDYLLYYLVNKNTDCVSMFSTDDLTEYYVSKTSVATYISNYSSNVNVAGVFYFYRSDLDEYTLYSNDYRIYREYLRENNYFMDAENQNASWHLVEINGSVYLARNLNSGSMYYGAFLKLEDVLDGIEDYLDYPVSDIWYTEEYPDVGSWKNSTIWCERAGIYLTLIFERTVFTENIAMWRYILVGLVIFYVFLTPVLFLYTRKWLIIPLRELNDAHHHLETGDEGWRIRTTAGSREFQNAYDSFNRMADGIQNLRLENTNKELAYKQMLLDNLQLQIRPHFLLNCFNLLYSMIQTKKNEGAEKMILYLSQYFRYLFQYSSSLELFPKEYDLIEKYIEISGYEHPGEFTFQSEFDPEISMVRVPPLLFHNFIENIFAHALVHGRVVHIQLSGFYEEGVVTFRIADDGSGVGKEEVERINSGNFPDYQRGRHVGLRNSIKRLQFFYHNEATVRVESAPDEGTMFIITFPYNLEEDENESIDGE